MVPHVAQQQTMGGLALVRIFGGVLLAHRRFSSIMLMYN
jgi:hypothetical protein